jgi:predicted metal-binding membrane protein
MAMPGGWTMSMAWMRMPGQTWTGAAATFLGMWEVMMVAMMMPCLLPMLHRYRRAVGEVEGLAWRTLLVGTGYYAVWAAVGMIAFPLGIAVAAVEMQVPAIARCVPSAAGAVVAIAGALQFTVWKGRQLACCRAGCSLELPPDAGSAWRHGLRLGIHCSYCCVGLTVVLLVIGVMDLRAMAVVTVAMTAERLAPAGERIARGTGVVTVLAGALMIARATGFAA